MAAAMTVTDVLDGQVALDLECLDRIYLNAYMPNLHVGGQVVSFLPQHLGNPIPSPAIFEKIGTAFRQGVSRFAEDERIPVRFTKDDRKKSTPASPTRDHRWPLPEALPKCQSLSDQGSLGGSAPPSIGP
jgi:hypothetical protein